jgi:LAO/AO transport system kinase
MVPMSMTERILQGDVRATARLIREIDDGVPAAQNILKELYPHTGKAYVVGITGAPGVGKSTLVDRFIQHLRAKGKTIGVVAVDPTSPFTGGAILGDRVRMQRHSTDEGVFIRSLATRGHFGGLTPSTRSVVNVLDAMGKDIILLETVGVGQDEVEVVRTAHTTIIMVIPGMGDEIQAIKAGILEVGDLFVINKADREGADQTFRELKSMLEMDKREERDRSWVPPVIKTDAIKDAGVEEVLEAVERHREHLLEEGGRQLEIRMHKKYKMELLDLLKYRIIESFLADIEENGGLDALLEEMAQKKFDPYSACDYILKNRLKR